MRTTGERATLNVALLGCGVVGSAVYRLLTEQSADLAARAGARLEVAGVAVRDTSRARGTAVPAELLTTDARALVTRPDVDIVIELIGGIEPARGPAAGRARGRQVGGHREQGPGGHRPGGAARDRAAGRG